VSVWAAPGGPRPKTKYRKTWVDLDGGNHIELRRIALLPGQVTALPSFPASTKSKDTRYKWFVDNRGTECWELDAMDHDDLRALVENEINALIDRPRCRLNFSGVALGPSLARLQAAAAPVWVATR
jgi:hypothetical protein